MYIKLYLIWPDSRFLSINTSMILPGDFYIINFTAENKVQIIIIIISFKKILIIYFINIIKNI